MNKSVVVTIIFALTCIFLEIQECTSNEISNKLKEVSDVCRNRESTPQNLIEKIRFSDLDGIKDIEKIAKCHIKCMMEVFEVLDNGNLSDKFFVQKLAPHIGESKAHELYAFCKDESGSDEDDECDRPFKIFVCLKKLSDIFNY
ncbi:uncharacterized protein LOC129939358 [Eupeodes corollae]|uniref:uncharacterized protein LOC129939358 n=1 Tax=Eupeodes corollae TaxID=290404 RepID=UPI00248FF582|nr:uncharacterized protein LOC129939358 [Eupeodes corollae]